MGRVAVHAAPVAGGSICRAYKIRLDDGRVVFAKWLADAPHGLFAAETCESKPNLDLRPRPAHFPGRAKAMIMLMQTGGPSNMDLFDYKPELSKRDGQVHDGNFETFQQGNSNKLMGTPYPFKRYGQCGMELSELLPHTGSIADELCLVRSLVTDNNNHTEAIIMFASGKILPGRPTLGAWLTSDIRFQ